MVEQSALAYRKWHEPLVQLLVRARSDRGIHHALLLEGPPAMGKRHFAELASQFLLCSDQCDHQLLACGSCASCELLAAGTHPDLHRLEPEEGKQIAVDAVRQLRNHLLQTPQVGKSKVCLIAPADALNENSASALLKLLEEPPEGTHFLLVADKPQQILPTIRSRCFPLAFCMPANDELAAYLSTLTADTGAVGNALNLSRGFPEKAIEFVLNGGDVDGELNSGVIAEAKQLANGWLEGRLASEPKIAALAKLPLKLLLDTALDVVHQRLIENMRTGDVNNDLEISYRHLLDASRSLPRNPNAKLLLQSLNIDVPSNLSKLG